MATIPQSFINDLITQGEWDTIFDGSVVSLVGMNFAADGSRTGAYGDTPYPANFRYLTYTTTNYPPVNGRTSDVEPVGGIWGTTLDDAAKWIFIPQEGTNFFAMVPYNTPTLSISWRKSGNYPTQLCYIGTSSTQIGEWQRFSFRSVGPATYNGIDYVALALGNIFDDPTKGISNAYTSIQYSLFGLIPTDNPGTAQLLSVITPGEKLKQKYCDISTNLNTKFCQNYCTASTANCSDSLDTYCNGTNLSSDICVDYCGDKNINCDLRLTSYCAQLLSDQGGDVQNFLINPTNANICGCFMDSDLYSSFAAAIQKAIGTLPSGDVKNCYFPYCVSSLHPDNFKNSPVCPSTVNCFNVVNINNDGSIGGVTINQKDSSCQSLEPGGGGSGSGDGGGGSGGGGAAKPRGKNTVFYGIIIVVIALGAAGVLGHILQRSKSKNK